MYVCRTVTDDFYIIKALCYRHSLLTTVLYTLQNASVIRAVTIPNVMLNTSELQTDGIVPSSRFFAGDWKDFADLISAELSENRNRYDYILTSETIYNPDNHRKLLAVFKECLKPGGVMYPLKLVLSFPTYKPT
jgi:SAM-dependent methyltransferase